MLNMAVEMGRFVATPELKHTSPAGIPFTRFTLAIDRDYKNEGKERDTDFIDFVAWRGTAEFVCRNFIKGQMAIVKGGIQTHTYTNTQGDNRKVFEIIADDIYFAGGNKKV